MRNLMSSALFSLPFLGYQPVNISNGEPAITAGNLAKQTILGAPFTWPWNRANFTVLIGGTTDDFGNPIPATQDYNIPLPKFGFLEKVWLLDSNGKVMEIKVKLALSWESVIQRPASIAAQTVNDDGTVTLRLNTVPDGPYTLSGCYQMVPPTISSLASSWAPIPDQYGYIYEWGFLAFVSMLTKDARSPAFMQRFIAHLLGAQDGLTATQRNIFVGNFLEVLTEPQRATSNVQQGQAARQA
jgi:hypothetical protein